MYILLILPVAIDVVKTRIQVDPEMARMSLLSGGRRIVAQEGPTALLTGFGPTAVGYLVQVCYGGIPYCTRSPQFLQGGAKFSGYEFWKKQFVQIAGDQETAVKYRTAIYLGASSVAEYVKALPVLLHSSPGTGSSLTSSSHRWKPRVFDSSRSATTLQA